MWCGRFGRLRPALPGSSSLRSQRQLCLATEMFGQKLGGKVGVTRKRGRLDLLVLVIRTTGALGVAPVVAAITLQLVVKRIEEMQQPG